MQSTLGCMSTSCVVRQLNMSQRSRLSPLWKNWRRSSVGALQVDIDLEPGLQAPTELRVITPMGFSVPEPSPKNVRLKWAIASVLAPSQTWIDSTLERYRRAAVCHSVT
eukprot:4350063-Amphidinium_carterae.1